LGTAGDTRADALDAFAFSSAGVFVVLDAPETLRAAGFALVFVFGLDAMLDLP
jgi:hypothetical protein